MYLRISIIPETVVPIEVSINQEDADGIIMMDIYYTPKIPEDASSGGLF